MKKELSFRETLVVLDKIVSNPITEIDKFKPILNGLRLNKSWFNSIVSIVNKSNPGDIRYFKRDDKVNLDVFIKTDGEYSDHRYIKNTGIFNDVAVFIIEKNSLIDHILSTQKLEITMDLNFTRKIYSSVEIKKFKKIKLNKD
jgi:hypothetical protein